MADIVDLAIQLGQALSGSDRFKRLKAEEKAVREDEAAKQLTKDLQTQGEKIAQLEANLQPVEVVDKQEMQRIQTEVASNEALKQFSAAHADWAELMNKVHDAIQEQLTI